MTKEQVLQECTIEGNVVKLPNVQLDRKEYMEVKKALELIGGKWKGGKVAGFVFATDPTDLLNQVANGEKRNLKKEFQFFKDVDHKSWCFTKEDGNMTTRIEVREITNGFIVRKNVYGHKNDDEYFDEYTETYYEDDFFE